MKRMDLNGRRKNDRNKKQINNQSELLQSLDCSPNSPLWKRVPTRDDQGNYVGDFMMIIPGLKNQSAKKRKKILNDLASVLEYYREIVVFADLNLKMNLLWVSIKPVKGMFIEIPASIIASVPGAKLISDRPPGK